jgi:4-hydroxy-tetrahydrodipicolinate reductase
MVLSTPGLSLVGAVDYEPGLAGRPLSEVLGSGAPGEIEVSSSLEEACAQARSRGLRPAVVLHCTGSRFGEEYENIETCLEEGLHVVSSCEELAAPELRWPKLAAELNSLARARDLTVLATGVNPGFVMDRLPLVASSMCSCLEEIEVRRVVEASTRRVQLQKKIGVGMAPEAFEEASRAGNLGHVGLVESLAAISRALGRRLTLEDVEERLEPVLARGPGSSALGPIEPGQVVGIYQTASTRPHITPCIRLELIMAIGVEEAQDVVTIRGQPSFSLTIPGGLEGDSATCAALVNAIAYVSIAPRGIVTPAELAGPTSLSEVAR